MGIRSERVKRQMEKEISRILQEDLKDPRIKFVTITRVDLTGDLRYAKVYFSILDEDIDKESVLEGINSATGYIRRLVGERLDLRYVPEISFRIDNSIEYSIKLEETFERLKNEREKNSENNK